MKVVVIDDERLARADLIKMLEKDPSIQVLGEASNADEGIDLIEKTNPDLVFLDIQMPGKTGFDMLEEMSEAPEVIFVTAYDEYALRAFEFSALDYLMKPVEHERLTEAIEKINRPKIESDLPAEQLTIQNKIFIKDGEKCWFVPLSDVRAFESEGNYVRVYFNEFKPLILRSLNYLEERLDEKNFFRASRKHIINLHWVDSIEPWFNGGLRATLKNGMTVEVSRRQSAKFKDLMSL